ncbi:unnamed protein product [Prorocentrum cordatum]|uniref:Uncharacterized protein n=1 Tax=Prorocentrum cordatum TaxID=2364126 RepID=A0ABN9VB06_9DINO|nr:unnamed protein product [Polarella glacialis]
MDAAAAAAEGAEPVPAEGAAAGGGSPSAAELKAEGNAAYQRQDVQAAVGFWNAALREHVEGLGRGGGPPSLSQESRALELSLYLNLAQGYLKLGDPGKALRACQVAAGEDPGNAKAHFRAAEACLALSRPGEAERWLAPVADAQGSGSEAAALLRRVRAGRAAEAKREREVAKRMAAGALGFSEGREASEGPGGAVAGALLQDPASMACGAHVAEAAARAAQARETRLHAAADPLPEPRVDDLDAFRAKVLARSRRMNSSMQRSLRGRDRAQGSLRLEWLRSGQDGAALESFASPLQAELRAIAAEGQAAAEAEAEAAERAGVSSAEGASGASSASAGATDGDGPRRMDEMD